MLYECLVGRPPFAGPSAQAVLAQILTEKPATITKMRRSVPHNVAGAVAKAIEKLPADRFGTVDEFAAALGDPGFRYGEAAAQATTEVRPWQIATGVSTLALLALGAVSLLGGDGATRAVDAPVSRSVVNLGSAGIRSAITAISPDGGAVLFTDTIGGSEQYWLKRRADVAATPMGDLGERQVFSPDGEWVAFLEETDPSAFLGAPKPYRLFKVPTGGGGVVPLADSVSPPLAWLSDGTLLVAPSTGASTTGVTSDEEGSWYPHVGVTELIRMSDSGQELGRLDLTAGDSAFVWFNAREIPGAEALLLVGCPPNNRCVETELRAFDMRSGDVTRLPVNAGLDAWPLESGHVVFAPRGGGMMGVPFDLRTLSLDGGVVPIFDSEEILLPLVSPSGTVLYLEYYRGSFRDRRVQWLDASGSVEEVDPAWATEEIPSRLTLNSDASRLAYALRTDSAEESIWVKDLPRGPAQRVARLADALTGMAWSEDDGALYFVERAMAEDAPYRSRISRVPADGSIVPEVLHESEDVQFSHVALADRPGRLLVSWTKDTDGVSERDIGILNLATGQVSDLLTTSALERYPELDPSGRWLAYSSNTSGREEVYVRPCPDVSAARYPISVEGGFRPQWSADGDQILFTGASRLATVVDVEAGGDVFQVLDRQPFAPGGTTVLRGEYELSPVDGRIITVGSPFGDLAVRTILIENWLTEVRGKLGGSP